MTAHDDAVKAAVEAIRRTVWGDDPVADDWTVEAEAAVAAAAPILLAAERQRIAEALRAEAESTREGEPPVGICCELCHAEGFEVAARIAERNPE